MVIEADSHAASEVRVRMQSEIDDGLQKQRYKI